MVKNATENGLIGKEREISHSSMTFSLLDLESGMRDYMTDYVVEGLNVTDDDNIRISFKVKSTPMIDSSNHFYLFIKLSSVKSFLSLVDKMFFGKKPVKLEKTPWITFYFGDESGRQSSESGMIFLCKLIAGLPENENVDFLLRWVYYAIEKNVAMQEINTVLQSKEMSILENELKDTKKIGYSKDLINEMNSPPITSIIKRIGMGDDFDPERIAMEGLGYKKHGDYMLQEIKKDYIIVLSMKLKDAKVIAEKMGILLQDKKNK